MTYSLETIGFGSLVFDLHLRISQEILILLNLSTAFDIAEHAFFLVNVERGWG